MLVAKADYVTSRVDVVSSTRVEERILLVQRRAELVIPQAARWRMPYFLWLGRLDPATLAPKIDCREPSTSTGHVFKAGAGVEENPPRWAP